MTEKLDKVDAQVTRIAVIIDHLRTFGRKTPETMQPVRPFEVAGEALLMIGEQLRLANISVVSEPGGEELEVLAHPVQLEQICLNLLTNARDAMNGVDGERVIRIACRLSGESVLLSVTDSAGGIEVPLLERIFDPFFTTKEPGKGTGLGLSISNNLVSEMHGTLEAENVEGGARFTIRLPSHPGKVATEPH